MKKVISLILVLCMMIPFTGCAFAEEVEASNFVKVKALAGEDANWLTLARYKDTKEVIPLSEAVGDYVYATIPIENKDREIESFNPEALKFTDIDDTNPDFDDVKMLSYVSEK